MAKSFSDVRNPAEQYISAADGNSSADGSQKRSFERKDRHVHILLKQSLFDKAKLKAYNASISINEYINQLIAKDE